MIARILIFLFSVTSGYYLNDEAVQTVFQSSGRKIFNVVVFKDSEFQDLVLDGQ